MNKGQKIFQRIPKAGKGWMKCWKLSGHDLQVVLCKIFKLLYRYRFKSGVHFPAGTDQHIFSLSISKVSITESWN